MTKPAEEPSLSTAEVRCRKVSFCTAHGRSECRYRHDVRLRRSGLPAGDTATDLTARIGHEWSNTPPAVHRQGLYKLYHLSSSGSY